MAAGDFTFFTQFKQDLGNKIHDMDGDTFKFALITNAVTPAETDAAPHWGGTGTTNFNTNEVTAGGNYTAEGIALVSPSWSISGANVKWDANDISIAQHASNPTNARWGIIYNDTDANKRAVGFVDLGSVRDLTTGNFSYALHANGLATLS